MACEDAGTKEEESKEIEALCAEADVPIDDLLPAGYLEHLNKLQESGIKEDHLPAVSKRRGSRGSSVSGFFLEFTLIPIGSVTNHTNCSIPTYD